jgi:replicative DNA helicase
LAEKKEPAKKDPLIEEVYGAEGYLTALFWNDPQLYNLYNTEKLNSKMFGSSVWGFFFGLGREMHNDQIAVFDMISVHRTISKLKMDKHLEKYNGYKTIQEVMEEVVEQGENSEAYYSEVKKYHILRGLRSLFGEKVTKKDGKYDYHKMNREQIHTYWMDKINNIGLLDGDSSIKVDYLLKGLRESVKKWSEEPDIGLEFYDSKYMTRISAGWADGCLYLFGGFGGKGKSSITFTKVILSCIVNKQKLLVIANEQEIEDFKKMLLITAMGNGTHEFFVRTRINEGNFTEDEEKKLENAIKWVESVTGGKDGEGLIAFAFLESYNMQSVKQIVRRFAHRGYKKLLIDTGKPSDGNNNNPRWQQFTEDMTELYQLIRPTGLNIATWVNVQLADNFLNMRFLNEMAFGDSKKIKNEATVALMFRHVFSDELKEGRHELKVTRYVKDELNGGSKAEEFTLEPTDKDGRPQHYALLFTPKNRRGMDNNTGQRILVFRVDMNRNIWKEIGWTTVEKDFSM